jgi:CheY-like chemotaxis protein
MSGDALFHVLYVEDDPMNRKVVRDMLSVAGLSMVEAHDGAAGLAALDAGEFDIILMDLRMPGMDGLEAVRRIRSRDDHKAALPIIIVTADLSVSIREDCLAAGANELMFKPVAMQQLFDSICLLISQSDPEMMMV